MEWDELMLPGTGTGQIATDSQCLTSYVAMKTLTTAGIAHPLEPHTQGTLHNQKLLQQQTDPFAVK